MSENAGDVAGSDQTRLKLGHGLGLGLALGGVCGVVAVLSSAAASHAIDNQYLMVISQITMMHAAAFVGLGVAHGMTSSRGSSLPCCF